MDPKPRPDHKLVLEALRRMTPEEKLAKAFELSALAKQRRRERLRRWFPNATEADLRRMSLHWLEKKTQRELRIALRWLSR